MQASDHGWPGGAGPTVPVSQCSIGCFTGLGRRGGSLEDPVDDSVGLISVVIIEDHAAVAESLATALSAVDGIDVIETADNLQAGLSIVGVRRPQVVLMDAALPDGDGAEAAPAVYERSPNSAVVVISGSRRPATAVQAIRCGATGYVSKVDPLKHIIAAVRTAASGGTTFTPEQIRAAINADAAGDATALSDRELEVLKLLAQGKSTDELAQLLTLSPHTIRNHIRNVLTKLDAGSRLEAVAVAHRQGLVDLPR